MKNINRLRGFFPKLDEVLDWFPHNRIKSIVFTRRKDFHSVAFISHFVKGTDDEANFEKICQYNFPTEWYETESGWVSYVAVDLESVGTNKLRVYKNLSNISALAGTCFSSNPLINSSLSYKILYIPDILL